MSADNLLATDSTPKPPYTVREAITSKDNPRIAIIRTSDRSMFKRCRRKWDFESAIRKNLAPIDRPSYFWIGTGGHFAMEDFHGHNYYGDPVKAFIAYCDACVLAGDKHRIQVPDDFEYQKDLGIGVIRHYTNWLRNRDPFETVWMPNAQGVSEPCVEVKCRIPLPIEHPDFDEIYYQMTLDRLVVRDGEYWILDWKFFKQFSATPLEFNGQMSAYIWGSHAMWDVPIAGAVYHEFLKKIPEPARILKNGTISTAKNQATSHIIYRDALEAMYGDPNKAPSDNILCLNWLADQEDEHRDKFCKRTFTTRNQAQLESEGERILMEVSEMLDSNLPLYTNPTRDCGWDCQFREACLMMDRDDDWESFIAATSISRAEESEEWRRYLK
ncbi:MAG: hypothetical protein COA78_31455 [Blastopirellula sp.]|nr:MAG: hypothetical protein COA78_31455 [Blastopirellula sp.]